MSASADIVVAGAGHNSLLTACYLAKAGYRCLVLDARSIPGEIHEDFKRRKGEEAAHPHRIRYRPLERQ